MLVNGYEYSWAQVVMVVAGNVINGVTEINYGHRNNNMDNWGAGIEPVSRTYGKYMTENCSVTLHMSELEALARVAPNNRIMELPMFDITVSYISNFNTPVVHKLRGVQFLNNGRALKQTEDGAIAQTIDLLVAQIDGL